MVTIPAGSTLHLPGPGERGGSGRADVLLTVNVNPPFPSNVSATKRLRVSAGKPRQTLSELDS
jgi:hypothetical protein